MFSANIFEKTTPTLWIMALTALVVLFTTTQSFRVPQVDPNLPHILPGAADFSWAFKSTLAVRDGNNPYTSNNIKYADPYKRKILFPGEEFYAGYPPSHYVLYLPLTWITDNWRQAANYFYIINLLTIIALSWLTALFIREVIGAPLPLLYFPLLILVFSGFAGTRLGIERGQSDLLNALFAWSGAIAFLRGRFSLAGFLLFIAASLKGYGALVWTGIAILSLYQHSLKKYITGTAIGCIIFLLPVLHLMPDALYVVNGMQKYYKISTYWFAFSFRNFSASIGAEFLMIGTIGIAANILVMALTLWRMLLAFQSGTKSEKTIWLVLFVTTALMVPLGLGTRTFIYSLVFLLPGFIIFPHAIEILFPQRLNPILNMATYFVIAGMLILMLLTSAWLISTAAIANFVFILLVGFIAFMHWKQHYRKQS